MAVRHRYHGGTTWGIPARSARMTADFEKALSFPRWNQPGDSSVAPLPLNDVQELRCSAGCDSSVDAEAQVLRHSEAAGRGIPRSGATPKPWTREGFLLHRHPRAAGIPYGGAGQYVAGDAEAQGLRHSEGYASTPWNPPLRAEWYVVVTVSNQPGDSSVADAPSE